MKCRKVSHLAHNFENSNFPRLIRQFAKCHSQSATPLLLHTPHPLLSLPPSLACDFTVASASIIFQMYIYYRKCKTTSMKAAPREGIRNSGRKVFVVCVCAERKEGMRPQWQQRRRRRQEMPRMCMMRLAVARWRCHWQFLQEIILIDFV